MVPVPRVPALPADAWLSHGQRVLHLRALIWDRWTQALEVTSGQLLPDQEFPLLQRRAEGWTPCAPQWEPPRLLHL